MTPFVSLDAALWNAWEQVRRLDGDGIDVSELLRAWEDRLVDVWRNELAAW